MAGDYLRSSGVNLPIGLVPILAALSVLPKCAAVMESVESGQFVFTASA
jgi:hypothetical protein